MKRTFDEALEYGEIFEDILQKALKREHFEVTDCRHIHRDNKNRKFPDFHMTFAGNPILVDAKRQKKYNGYFGISEEGVCDYRSIANESGMPVYLAFWDEDSDPDYIYLLNVSNTEDYQQQFFNEHGKRPKYMWHECRMWRINKD